MSIGDVRGRRMVEARMMARIMGFLLDEEGHWVAELSCGHARHFRHEPPWQCREWVLSPEGRALRVGTEVSCLECGEGSLGADPSTG